VNLVQKGYQLHDRLLRPAMVGVSKAAEQAKNEDSSQ
jgi:molecular chaperone GrpE (heat shock protein)